MSRTTSLSACALISCCLCASAPAADAAFRRSDTNADGATDLSDAVFTLSFLFLGGASPPCLDAADTNDDGAVNLSDGIATLNHLFLDGPAPAPPYEACGADPTADELGCGSFAPCPRDDTPAVSITEVLADNTRTLRDGDGELSDWIELTNTGSAAADISGHYLTDDLDDLTKWAFPEGTRLEPGEALVVFASGRDAASPFDRGGRLHASFALDADGEPVALVRPDGSTVLSSLGPDVPRQLADVSWGLSEESSVVRFLVEDGETARYAVVTEGLEPGWMEPGFDDGGWNEGRTGLGYETDDLGLFRGKLRTDLGGVMRGVSSSAVLRIPFVLEDPAAVESLVLWMRWDDGFIAALNGVEVARDNAPLEPSPASTALEPRDDGAAVAGFTRFDLGDRLDLLVAGPNVLAVRGFNDGAGSSRFLVVPVLEARVRGRLPVYFRVPTPGGPNGPGVAGIVRDTEFSVDRGFHDGAFDVAITTGTPGAEIRYTLDGSAPGPTTGDIYAAPLRVETTTTLRAAAFREDLLATDVDTQTYLFLADVIRQPLRPAALPATWAGVPADYGMDPEIVDHPAYRDSIEDDLAAIPSLSIVMDPADLFGPNGLYQNPEGRGLAWERAASMELFSAGGREDLQEEAGIRIHGGAGRRPEHPKKSFRLIFRKRYGAGKLRYPLFEGEPYGRGAVEEFDKLVLRAGFNNTVPHWYDEQVVRAQYVRDQWARDIQLEMGHPSPRGRYVHLYLNGLYWGLYNITERPDEDWGATYFGGEPEDYDVIKNRAVTAGSAAGWNELQALATGGVSDAEYDRAGQLADLANLADHMLENIWFGNTDWDHNNSVAVRRRVAGGPFIFPNWDAEFGICLPPGAQPNRWDTIVGIDVTGVNNPNAASAVFQSLRTNAEFALLLADRIHRHFFHGGLLTPERASQLWTRRADEVYGPVVGESARWGDYRRDVYSQREPQSVFPLFTRDEHWLEHGRWILEEYFPQRAQVILAQFRAAGYWPDVTPPELSQWGGTLESGFELGMSTTSGTLYYTVDGSDPRLRGGGVSPRATEAATASSTVLVEEGAPARVLVPADGSVDGEWTAPGFDDGSWIEGAGGVGYDRNDTFRAHIGTDVGALMDGLRSSVYVRVPFVLAEEPELDSLVLRMRYDDGFVAYLTGVPIAARNAPEDPRFDSVATRSNPDRLGIELEEIDVSEHRGLLRPGANVLAVHGLNFTTTSSDLLVGWELATRKVAVARLRIDESLVVKARSFDGTTWTPLSEALFVVETGIRVSELMYHPPAPTAVESDAGFTNAEGFEFVEIANFGSSTASLAGWRIDGGIDFEFPDVELAPGERAVVVRDRSSFLVRYGLGPRILGEYARRLSNGGDSVGVVGALGADVVRFAYDDDWYPATDGGGHSLVLESPDADPNERASWRPSAEPLGTPGR